jgi:hypothetical protein
MKDKFGPILKSNSQVGKAKSNSQTLPTLDCRKTTILAQNQITRMKKAYLENLKEVNSSVGKENTVYNGLQDRKEIPEIGSKTPGYSNNREYLKFASLEKTKDWPNTVIVKQREQQKQRYLKFERDEMERRRLEDEEEIFQKAKNEAVIRKANQQFFQNNDKVKAFNSKLLEADVVEERKRQIDFKNFIKQAEVERDKDIFIQEVSIQQQAMTKEQRLELQKQQKLQEHLEVLKNQVEELNTKQKIYDNNEKIEGMILKKATQIAVQKGDIENLKNKEKKQKFAIEMRKGNEEIQKQRELQVILEAEQDKLIEKYFINREKILAERKEEEIKRVLEKQIARSKVSEDRARDLLKINTKQTDDINKQIEEYKAKVERLEKEHQSKYQKRMKNLQDNINQQIAYKIQTKKEEEERLKMKDLEFQRFWNSKNNEIQCNEHAENGEKIQIIKGIAEFNKMLVVD